MKPRILITPGLLHHQPGPYRDLLEQAGLEPVYPPTARAIAGPGELHGLLDGISGVVASVDPFTPDVLAQAPSLRVIARMGVGYDSIDVAEATRRGVVVTITPGTNHDSVAEQTLALLFAVFRGVVTRDAEVRRGVWRREPLPRLAGRTIGLVGLGRIGRAMAERCVALGLRVLAHDPFADSHFAARHGVSLASLDDLFAASDIVSLHCPCTAETENLINAASIARMRPGAVLINTARGALVDEAALYEALRSGRLRGAGLDVFRTEPPGANPLFELPNVVVAPHMAGLDDDSTRDMAAHAARCVADLYRGLWPVGSVVNPELRRGWSWARAT
jgi:phosphoglycerate dehydrogenase-like enzyme